jgi:serine/threonine protein kinase
MGVVYKGPPGRPQDDPLRRQNWRDSAPRQRPTPACSTPTSSRHEVGEHEGNPYFSLEFCPGGGLGLMLDGAPLLPQDAARLLETLARAMHAAHDKSVIHRDLKPANILLGEDGTPKITDFGLAKKLDDDGRPPPAPSWAPPWRLFLRPSDRIVTYPSPFLHWVIHNEHESIPMKKQQRLAGTGKQKPPLMTPEADLPVAIFKTSLRSWQARWQARKAADQAGAAGRQGEPEAE